MSRLGRVFSIALVLTSFTSTVWAADVIEVRGETAKLNGTVTDVSKDKVSFKTTKDEVKELPVGQISQIIWEGEPTALKQGRSHEAGGRLPQAMEAYAKAATDYKGDKAPIKADIDYFNVRVQALIASNDPTKIDDALKTLNDFLSKNSSSRHFYEASGFLVELNLAKKDAAGAKAAAEALAKSPGNEQKMAAKIALGRVALMENQIAEAQKLFDEAVAMPTNGPAEESRKQEARLGLAHCLYSEKKFDEAITLLDDVIAKSAPEDGRVQAEAYVRQGDCYLGANKSKEALLAYLHVDVLFPTQKAVHPEALYHLSQLWTVVQQPDRATEAVDKLNSEYPNSPWTQKLKTAPAAG